MSATVTGVPLVLPRNVYAIFGAGRERSVDLGFIMSFNERFSPNYGGNNGNVGHSAPDGARIGGVRA